MRANATVTTGPSLRRWRKHFSKQQRRSDRSRQLEEWGALVIRKLIAPMVRAGRFNLDLSDRVLTELTGCSTQQARTIRRKLREAGITKCHRRSRRAGDYPLWLVAKEFLKWAKSGPRKPRTFKSYNEQYARYYRQALAAASAELREFEARVSTDCFMLLAWGHFRDILARHGVTRSDLLRAH